MTGPRRVKHVPQRTCIGCREVNAKRQFVRLVRTPTGQVTVDPSGKAAGRGAYLHARQACWEQALAKRMVEHALKTSLTDADRTALRAIGAQYPDDDPA